MVTVTIVDDLLKNEANLWLLHSTIEIFVNKKNCNLCTAIFFQAYFLILKFAMRYTYIGDKIFYI